MSCHAAQALASTNETGHAITREILRVKLNGQAAVARLLASHEIAELILKLAGELDSARDKIRLLAIKAMTATAYWPLCQPLPLRFARREQIPEHWRTYGNRHSPLSGKPLKAASPGNAILNYLYAVAVGEMTIALTGTGLDPGMGIFHADQDRRASLAYDAIEAVRPYVDAWLVTWLATCLCRKSNPNVLVMQTTKMRLCEDPTDVLNFAWNRRVFVQRQMRPGLFVICHVGHQYVPKVTRAKHDNVSKCLPPDRANQAFGIVVL